MRYLICFILLFSMHAAYASTLVFCSNCSSESSYDTLAMQSAPNRVGKYEFHVMNVNTSVTYEIWVEVDGDVTVGGQHIRGIISSSTWQELNAAYSFWYHIFFPDDYPEFNYVAGSSGAASFADWTPEVVCNDFVQTQDWMDLTGEYDSGGPLELAGDEFLVKIGHGPIASYVFQNGDVAEYYMQINESGPAACAYVPGSARNALGEFINDSGNGGHGHSNGSDYVVAGSNYTYQLQIEHYYYVCSYLEHPGGTRELIGCVRE